MGQILIGIWNGAPIWVWPLFFVLLALGLFAMKTRHSSIIPYFFYPLFGLSAVNSLKGLSHVPTNWIVFACLYLIGMALAFRWQDRLILEKAGRSMRVRGEKITLLILMLTFFSNFVNGMMAAMSPQSSDTVLYTVIFAGVIGACSGSFTGRALRVITLGARPKAASA